MAQCPLQLLMAWAVLPPAWSVRDFAEVLDDTGEQLFARSVVNDQAALEALLGRAAQHGTVGLVIDQPGSIAQLALAGARNREMPVAYVPGLVMRRAADLYPGEAKSDKRDAFIIADTGRTRRKQCTGSTPAPMSSWSVYACSTGSTSTWLPTRPGLPTPAVTPWPA